MAADSKIQVVSVAPERKYTKVYHDFLYSDLSAEEKLVYIALKTFVEFGKDGDSVFPSMETLSALTSMSVPRARRSINKLVMKGYVKKKRRGLRQPNLYEICDVAEIWKTDSPDAVVESQSVVTTLSDEVLLRELERRGYKTKKEEPVSIAVDPDSGDVENTFSENETTRDFPDRQVRERYSMAEIHSHFGYKAIAAAVGSTDADMVFDILYDTLTSDRAYIRVGQEDRPAEIVRGRLMKLSYSDIVSVIQRFHEQRQEITSPRAYILTQLYHSKSDTYFGMMNEGHVNGDF